MEKKKVIVSACLLGENCKYNGGNNYSSQVLSFLKDKEVIAVCPEVMGGLPIPRPCVELMDGVAVNKNGRNVDAYFRAGVEKVLEKIRGQEIAMAILQPRSPSCGAKQIYDGSFSGRLIPGEGMLAKALRQRGIPVVDASDL
ncbi:MAG: DUF523 domain-containing protein [Lachnospiraceae bacterium]|nr:DUF523 domain-containing protein [Lachnospiraceae bacterium]